MPDAPDMRAPDAPTLDALGGVAVLALMATSQEYGPALASRLTPTLIGVGPVEAAVNATRALAALERAGTPPALVLSIGSAGSNRLPQASVHRVESVSWRDIDASPFGFERGTTPFLDLPAERPLPALAPSLSAVRLSTGADVIPTPEAYAAIDADMVDMETFAVLRACDAWGVPLAGLRAVSDGDVAVTRYGDWADCLPLLDERLAEAVDALAADLAAGGLGRAARA